MKTDLLIVANFIVCSGIGWASFCRLNASSKAVRFSERLKYTLLMFGATASGMQGPMFGEHPGAAEVVFGLCVFIYVLAGMWRWKNGPPTDVLLSAFSEGVGHEAKR